MESTNNDTNDIEQDSKTSADTKDYYAVLGVPRNATEKQISNAYKKLALKYHPDRNQDDEVAANNFQAVNEAYHVLVDPNKRRQYDLGGEKAAPSDFESVDVSSLGGISRVFGAFVSRLGVPIPTQIAPEILEAAQTICKNGGLEGGGPPLDPRVSDLVWAWNHESKVDRQAAAYYRITVDSRQVENGFVVLCRSASKGKFKLILFDHEGAVLFQEESTKTHHKNSAVTQAALFFTNFDSYRLGEPPLSAYEKDMPPLFARLEGFSNAKKQLAPGQYLVCVYGDNFLGKTAFSIIAVQAKNDAPEVTQLEETDEQLIEAKQAVHTLRNDYVVAKAAYEEVLLRMKSENERVDGLIHTREAAYMGFLDASIKSFSPSAGEEHHTSAAAPVEGGEKEGQPAEPAAAAGPSVGAQAYNAAASTLGTAASTATAAGGWFARRLSMGLQSIVKPPAAAPAAERTDTTSETGAVVDDDRPSERSSVGSAASAGAVENLPGSTSTPSSDAAPSAAAAEPAAVADHAPVPEQAAHEEDHHEDAAPVAAATSEEPVTRPTIKSKKKKNQHHEEEATEATAEN